MALGRISSPNPSPVRQANPAPNLPPHQTSVEEFKEIQSLSEMLSVVQQDSDLNRLRLEADLARERQQITSYSVLGGGRAADPILSGTSEAFIDVEVPRGEIRNTLER